MLSHLAKKYRHGIAVDRNKVTKAELLKRIEALEIEFSQIKNSFSQNEADKRFKELELATKDISQLITYHTNASVVPRGKELVDSIEGNLQELRILLKIKKQ